MTAGKKTVEKKEKHNFSQFHRWLRDWESGECLTKGADDTNPTYYYDDVDYIISLSVINDSDDAYCTFNFNHAAKSFDKKVAGCATLTDAVVSQLSHSISGPRDMLDIVTFLAQEPNKKYRARDLMKTINDKGVKLGAKFRKDFELTEFDGSFLNEGLKITRQAVSSLRSEFNKSVIVDIKKADIIWISVAFFTMASMIALPGQTGKMGMAGDRVIGDFRIRCAVFANMKFASENVDKFLMTETGVNMNYMLDFGADRPALVIAVNDRSSGLSLLEQDCKALKEQVRNWNEH